MQAQVVGQLGVERRDHDRTLTAQHRPAVHLGQDLHVRTRRLHPRRPDEHGVEGPVEAVDSFISLTEASEYTTSEDDERARLAAEGEADIEPKIAAFNERMAKYTDTRLHPRLPEKKLIAFYAMTKTRRPGANWYELSFSERKELMRGHATIGRSYAGRILQLITGSTGLDDWEWGVTLLADDPVAIKEIVYEMRFDPVSATYGEFGPFWVGLVLPLPEVLTRAGLPTR